MQVRRKHSHNSKNLAKCLARTAARKQTVSSLQTYILAPTDPDVIISILKEIYSVSFTKHCLSDSFKQMIYVFIYSLEGRKHVKIFWCCRKLMSCVVTSVPKSIYRSYSWGVHNNLMISSVRNVRLQALMAMTCDVTPCSLVKHYKSLLPLEYFQFWRWRKQVSPKHWQRFTRLHGGME